MKVWNVTGWDREVKAGGKKYAIKAFSESKDIYDIYHVEHIANAYGYMGLVALNYDDGQEKVYPTYTEYKKAQEIKGLLAALKHAEDVLAYETNAKEACEKTPNAVHELRTFDVNKFKNNVKLITKWLTEAGYDDKVKEDAASEVVAKRPNWEKINEPGTTKDAN